MRTYNVDQTKNLRSLNPDGEFLAVDIMQNDGISAMIISVKLVLVMLMLNSQTFKDNFLTVFIYKYFMQTLII